MIHSVTDRTGRESYANKYLRYLGVDLGVDLFQNMPKSAKIRQN